MASKDYTGTQNNQSGNFRGQDNLLNIDLGNTKFISKFFHEPETVETIYKDLLSQGCKEEDITLVMTEDTKASYFSDKANVHVSKDPGNRSLEGGGIGAAIGGSLGGIAAAITAVGTSLAIPPLGIIVSGALAAGLAGMGAGAAAGGLLGTLVGLGIPDEQARIMEEELKKGGVLMGIKVNSEEDQGKWGPLLYQETPFHSQLGETSSFNESKLPHS